MSTAQENTVAIAELTVIAQRTTKDLDRVIKHLDQAPIARTIALEKRMNKVELRLPLAISKGVIMWGVVILLSGLGAIIGFAYSDISTYNRNIQKQLHNIDTLLTAHSAEFVVTKTNMQRRVSKLEELCDEK